MSVSLKQMSDAFRLALDLHFGLDEADACKHRLIERYKDRVSQRLLDESKRLEEKARVRAGDLFAELIVKPSAIRAPLFDALPIRVPYDAG